MARRTRPRAPALTTITDLHPDTLNANRGTPRGRAALEHSLRAFGPARSIVADRHGRVVAGNKTLAEALKLGLPIRTVTTTGEELVVVQRTDLDLDTPKARAVALADNRVAELDLEWDPAMLKQHHADGVDMAPFWTASEFDALLGEGTHDGRTEPDVATLPRSTDIKVGMVFELGRHRLLCGDATEASAVAQVLGNDTPRLMVTDPPYGVSYEPAWRHTYAPTQRTAVGRVLNDDRVDWSEAYRQFRGDVMYVWHAGLYTAAVARSIEAVGFRIRSQVIWSKQHFAMGRGDYHWQHEPCFYAVRRGARASWRGDRTQSTLWTVPNLNAMGGTRTGENTVTGHSTQKPVALFERPILNHCESDDAVFDPFVGSGTAVIAAEKTGRRCFAIELAPTYVQACIDRWEAFTGQRAVRVDVVVPRRRRS